MNSFSIIVPVFNVENYLEQCFNSLTSQEYNNYEIIVIDDGSTDNSSKIINEYKKKYPKLIKNYYKENGGLSSARNYGIKKSTKDYVLFVDSDDYISKDTLKILNQQIIETKSEIIVFNYIAVKNIDSIKINSFNKNIKDIDKRFLVSLPSACNKVFKRTLFNELHFEEGIYYEDLATIPRLIKQTNKITFIDDYLYYYFVRDNSITNKEKYNKKMDDIFYVVDLLKKELEINYKEEIEYIYIEHLLRNAGIRFINYKKYDKINNIINIIKKDFPEWKNNNYYKKYYTIKRKIMSYLIYKKQYKLINILRR